LFGTRQVLNEKRSLITGKKLNTEVVQKNSVLRQVMRLTKIFNDPQSFVRIKRKKRNPVF